MQHIRETCTAIAVSAQLQVSSPNSILAKPSIPYCTQPPSYHSPFFLLRFFFVAEQFQPSKQKENIETENKAIGHLCRLVTNWQHRNLLPCSIVGPHATSYRFSSPTTRLDRKLVVDTTQRLPFFFFLLQVLVNEAFGCNGPVGNPETRPRAKVILMLPCRKMLGSKEDAQF